MNTGTKLRIALLVVILLATLAIGAQANTITLPLIVHQASNGPVTGHFWITDIHGLSVLLVITVNQDIWTLEITELEDLPLCPEPTITAIPTVSPTITPGPTQEPPSGGYASLKTSTVFHKADCRYVVNRLPSELDTYATCDIALASGKRPCKSCDPCE